MVAGALTSSSEANESQNINSVLAIKANGEIVGRFDEIKLLTMGNTSLIAEAFPSLRVWFPRTGFLEPGSS